MTKEELRASAMALVRWLESQDISPTDSVPVLVTTMAYVTWQIANKHPVASKIEARKAAEMLAEMIQHTKDIFEQ